MWRILVKQLPSRAPVLSRRSLLGVLVVGILDLLFAFTFYGRILVTEIIGPAFLVGPPLALLARRSAK